MRWYLGTIKSGLSGQAAWEVGRHIRFAITPPGLVLCLGAGNASAILSKAEACRRLETVRRPDGSPQVVRNEDLRWAQVRGGRPFDGVRRKFIA